MRNVQIEDFFRWFIGIINFPKSFLNFCDDTLLWYQNSKLDLNLSCDMYFRNLSSMVTLCINWRWLLALMIFQQKFPFIKRLAITLMYCNKLHAWWSTQSQLVTLLFSLIAPWRVELQTIWRFWLKYLSIDKRAGVWCFVWFTRVYLLDFFCSGIQYYVLLSPYICFIFFLYLDLYVLRDGAWISYGPLMQTKHLCVLIHIWTKGEVDAVKLV